MKKKRIFLQFAKNCLLLPSMIIEQLLEIERDTFLWLNGSGHCAFLDRFLWLFSGKLTWLPLAAFFVAALFWHNRRHWREALLLLVAIAVVITVCDQFASGFCKTFFHRFRPTHHPDFMNDVITVNGYRGGRYGFISSHAANSFGFATLTATLFRRRAYTLAIFLWALINAYSRIYLGVHFISDIVPGILVGVLVGIAAAFLVINITRRPAQLTAAHAYGSSAAAPIPRLNINLILLALALTVLTITALSFFRL